MTDANPNGIQAQEVTVYDKDGNPIDADYPMAVALANKTSSGNSTSTPLLAGSVFTGEWERTCKYANCSIMVSSDVASATDGLIFQQSTNGVDVEDTDTYTVGANKKKQFTFGIATEYVRVVYTNGASPQSYFRLQTILHSGTPKSSSHRIGDSIIGDDDGELMKAVLSAEDENGDFVNIRAIQGQTGYNLKVSLDQIEPTTNSVKTIDYSHAELHAGEHYYYTDAVELDSAAVQNYLITTPNTTKWAHFTFLSTGSAVTQVELFEAADRTGTTLQTVLNNNRNSVNTAGVTIHKDYSGGATDGTRIYFHKSGSATNQSSSGAASRNEQEIDLKQNTKYILRVTSGTNDNLTNTALYWYEHTNIA